MLQAIGEILPLAVALAISSVPVTATLLILQSANRRRSSVAFLLGWVPTLAALFALTAWGLRSLPLDPRDKPERLAGIAMIVVGLTLIVLAIVAWRRSRGTRREGMPGWLRRIGSLGIWSSLGVGVILNLRPKSLLVTTAAALSLQGIEMSVGSASVVVVVYTLVASSTVAVPIVLTLLMPARMDPRLESMRVWLARNSHTVSLTILLVIGVVVLASGLTRL